MRTGRSLVSCSSLLWLSAALSLSAYGTQSIQNRGQISISVNSDQPILSSHAQKQLRGKLEAVAPAALQILNQDGSPLEIHEANVAFTKIEGIYDAAGAPVNPINDFAVKMSVRLSNTAARRVTGFGLAFEDPLSRNSFFVYRGRLEIGAGKWFTLDIPFMVLTGDPSSLSVKVYGGTYDDATTWGSFPFPSPIRTSRSNSAAKTPARPNTSAGAPDTSTDDRSTSALASPVDTKPRPLNGAHPRYTEQARKNGICGMVRLRLLIGADGNVIKVKAVSTLPDFLTEEAIRAAYELKFEPASKAGNPVAYWMPAEVEFNLK